MKNTTQKEYVIMRREVVHRTVYMAVIAHSQEEAFEICDNYQYEDILDETIDEDDIELISQSVESVTELQ